MTLNDPTLHSPYSSASNAAVSVLPIVWATITSNGLPLMYAMGLLSVLWLSVCLSVCNVGVLWPNGWMNEDATWYVGRPRPRRHYVRLGPSLPKKSGTAAPTFRPMSIVAKRSPILANTAEFLLYLACPISCYSAACGY